MDRWFLLTAVWLVMSAQLVLASESVWNFEDGNLGAAENKTNNKVATRLIENETKEGKYSVEMNNSTDGSAGFQIVVTNIESGKKYQASSWMKTDEKVKQGFLRIAWYESSDGSGSQMKTVGSEKLKGKQDWTWLISSQVAPENAKSAKIRVMIASESDGVEAKAKVDEIKWTQVNEQPTNTPVPTPTPTLKPEPTEVDMEEEVIDDENELSEEKEYEEQVLAKETINSKEIEENLKVTPKEENHASDSGLRNTRKIYKYEQVPEATGSFSLFKPPSDGWLAIGAGSLFIIVGAASYVKSFLSGEYNKKNEN